MDTNTLIERKDMETNESMQFKMYGGKIKLNNFHRLLYMGVLGLVTILIMTMVISCEDEPVPVETIPLDMDFEFIRLDPVYARAERNSSLYFSITNKGENLESGETKIVLPENIIALAPSDASLSFNSWESMETKTLQFDVEAGSDDVQEIEVVVEAGSFLFDTTIEVRWNSAVTISNPGYVPEPEVASTGKYLVGAHRCDLWQVPGVWQRYKESYPNRQPVVGWYKEGEPDVTDWEIKYALEHGIGFFLHCWYRHIDNSGQSPVEEEYAHVLKSYESSRYASQFKFALNWINSRCGVSGKDDLMNNVMPFLIETYFKKSYYLKIDNKPVMMIYGPGTFIEELGGEANAKEAVDLMREACIDAGFSGLILIGQYCWGSSQNPNLPYKTIGLDYSGSYHWPSFGQVLSNRTNPSGAEIIQGHKTCWINQDKYSALPNIITCSMGWDSAPWGYMTSKISWRLTPQEFQTVLQNAKDMMDTRDQSRLDSKMVLLDNWNEYGEGHYIFPTRQYAFGYLDAVRNVFSSADPEHIDLIPEDVGMNLDIYK